MPGVILGQIGIESTFALWVFMAGFCGLLLLAAMMVRMNMLHLLLGALLLFASMTPAVTADRTAHLSTLFLPLSMRRAELSMGAGLLLTVIVVVTGRIHFQNSSLAAWFISAIAVYAGLLQFIHDGPEIGAQSVGFALATIPAMAFATGAASLTYEGALKTVRTIMVVSVVWTFMASVEFVRNPQNVVNSQGRFFGLLANPQHAAVLCAPMAVCGLWLFLNDPKKRLRVLWVAMVGVNLLFLGWTGSRTGFGMFVVGLSFVLYRRMGQAVLMLPVLGLVVMGLGFLADELEITKSLERLTSMENTRGGLFGRFLDAVQQNPWIGVGWNETGYSENSYLVGFAGYGIGMFVLIVAFVLVTGFSGARLWFKASHFPKQERPLVDLYIAYAVMYFAGAAFEGYMLGRCAAPQVFMIMMSGLGVGLSRRMSGYDEGAAALEAERAEQELLDPYAASAYGQDQPA